MRQLRKALYFWPVALTVFISDCATKAVAERVLRPEAPLPLAGEVVRLSLVYNQSAAMSIDLGPRSRLLLTLVSSLALLGLWLWYRRPTTTGPMVVALALVWAGAAGNLWDRVRGTRGVVDFIDVGIAGWRFWVFNLADVAIVVGGFALLAIAQRQAAAPGDA
jgi:signal peptidase II